MKAILVLSVMLMAGAVQAGNADYASCDEAKAVARRAAAEHHLIVERIIREPSLRSHQAMERLDSLMVILAEATRYVLDNKCP